MLAHTDVVALWSANPLNIAENCRNAAAEQALDISTRCSKAAKRIICIDPMRSETMDFLATQRQVDCRPYGYRCGDDAGLSHAGRMTGTMRDFPTLHTPASTNSPDYLSVHDAMTG